MKDRLTILCGDALEMLKTLESESVQCCVTSPPYWGLRDYGTGTWEGGNAACEHSVGGQVQDSKAPGAITSGVRPGVDASICKKCGAARIDRQIGLERTPAEFIAKMVAVFEEVRRVLKKDGTCWVNLGDSYATGAGAVGDCPGGGKQGEAWRGSRSGSEGKHAYSECSRGTGALTQPNRLPIAGLKPKDLCGIPWRVAFALQAAGWYLRSDIIWHKPNPMPESVTDRPTKSHEYLFLLTKSERYYYDAEAILEPVSKSTHARLAQDVQAQIGSARANGGAKTNGNMKAVGRTSWNGSSFSKGKTGEHQLGRSQSDDSRKLAEEGSGVKNNASFDAVMAIMPEQRNKRSVWTVPTHSFKEAHFATYPPALITPCILAGSRPGDVVLDPFGGSGTTGQVALELGRQAILIELNPDYIPLIERRCDVTPGLPLFTEPTATATRADDAELPTGADSDPQKEPEPLLL